MQQHNNVQLRESSVSYIQHRNVANCHGLMLIYMYMHVFAINFLLSSDLNSKV